VVEGDRLVGHLSPRTDRRTNRKGLGTSQVEDVMQRDFVTADPRGHVHGALGRLQECGCRTIAGGQDGQVARTGDGHKHGGSADDPEALRGTRGRREAPFRSGREIGIPHPVGYHASVAAG